jgi:hypothetical protein
MAAMGGIHLEVHKDVVYEPLPVRRRTAIEMLQRLRAWPMLDGIRGSARADLDALAELMERLSIMVEMTGDAAAEIDLNPVFVYDAGKGVVVVDALIVGSASMSSPRYRGTMLRIEPRTLILAARVVEKSAARNAVAAVCEDRLRSLNDQVGEVSILAPSHNGTSFLRRIPGSDKSDRSCSGHVPGTWSAAGSDGNPFQHIPRWVRRHAVAGWILG